MNKSALGIMFRIPEYGKIKQRLAAQIGHDEALRVYSAMLYETIEKVSRLKGIDIYGFYDGRASRQANVLKGFEALPQKGNDLGEKMVNAIKLLFEKGYKKVVLIGSDSPDMPVSFISEAFIQLNSYELVIGPSSDGGYYLIGMHKLFNTIFKGIKWGKGNVLKETVFAAESEGIKYFLLPEWYDIDDIDSLKRWKRSNYTLLE